MQKKGKHKRKESVSPPSAKKSSTNTVSPAALAQASIAKVLSTPKSAPKDASEKSRRTIKMLRSTLTYIRKKENKRKEEPTINVEKIAMGEKLTQLVSEAGVFT